MNWFNVAIGIALLFVGGAIGSVITRHGASVWFCVRCPGCKKAMYIDPVRKEAQCRHVRPFTGEVCPD